MHVFISYAREDLERVRLIWTLLKEHNVPAWLDEESLRPGQDWEIEIRKAIRNCSLFLACLSTKSVVKRGYIQAELKDALAAFRNIPEGEVFIIPVRLEPCDLPISLERLQCVDFFTADGPSKLLAGIKLCIPVSSTQESSLSYIPVAARDHGFLLAEWAVVNELKGKPDVRWTPRIIKNAIIENRPKIAEQIVSEVSSAITRLIDNGYLRCYDGDTVEVTGKLLDFYREQKSFYKDKIKL